MGTREGGLRAAETNKQRYGKDFYKKIGRLGGILGHSGGFASQYVDKDGLTGPERAAIFGRIGGQNSKRPKVRV